MRNVLFIAQSFVLVLLATGRGDTRPPAEGPYLPMFARQEPASSFV